MAALCFFFSVRKVRTGQNPAYRSGHFAEADALRRIGISLQYDPNSERTFYFTMNNKIIPAVMLTVLIAAVIAGITLLRGQQKNSEESSVTEELAGTQMVIVPSEMPERISFDVPAGFTETSSQYYDKYYVLNDASVIVTGEELILYGTPLEDYAEQIKQQYTQTAENFRLLSEEKPEINQRKCIVYEFTYDITGGDLKQTMECTTAVFLTAQDAYIITCKSHADSYQTYRGIFRKMIESVQIADRIDDLNTDSTAAETQTLPDSTASLQ